MPESGGIYYYSHDGAKTPRPAILLLHGLGGDYLAWPVEIRRLPGFDVFTPDLPGHGYSSGPGMQAVDDYAAAMLEFMDGMGIWQAIMVGHSMGGAIALDPCLSSSGTNCWSCFDFVWSTPACPACNHGKRGSGTTYPSAVQSLHALMQDLLLQPAWRHKTKRNLIGLRPSLVLGDLMACDQFDLSACLPRINTTALVIAGMEDKLTPPRFSTFLAANIQRSSVADH